MNIREETLKIAHNLIEKDPSLTDWVISKFPELKESEDVRMKNFISNELACIRATDEKGSDRYNKLTEAIAWLKKQKNRSHLSKDEEYTLARIIEYLEDNDCPSKWKDLLHDVYALPYQKEQKEDVTRDKIAEYLKKLILDQSQRGAHILDYEGRIEEEVDFIISIAKKELKKVEQKSADKVEPKFHQGEWITNGDYTWKIIEVKPLDYILQSQDGNIVDDTTSHVDEQFHSFTIEDAKDSDVLAAHECIVLFKEIDGLNIKCHCTYHFMNNPSFYVNTLQNKSAFHPATKEQRDTLMKAMTDAGYTWDAEKKELKKLGQSEVTKTSDQEIGIAEIPFGAKDSELQEATYYIPKGFHAEIDDDKVVIKKGEKSTAWSKKDEKMFEYALNMIEWYSGKNEDKSRFVSDWLKSIKQRIGG